MLFVVDNMNAPEWLTLDLHVADSSIEMTEVMYFNFKPEFVDVNLVVFHCVCWSIRGRCRRWAARFRSFESPLVHEFERTCHYTFCTYQNHVWERVCGFGDNFKICRQ